MLTGATQNKIKIKLWNAKQKSNKYWKFDTWITLKFKKTIHNLVSNATTEKFFNKIPSSSVIYNYFL